MYIYKHNLILVSMFSSFQYDEFLKTSNSEILNAASGYFKHILKKPVQTEPPPNLLSAITIFFGFSGFVKIGYRPEIKYIDDEPNKWKIEVELCVVVVMGSSWMKLTREQWGNFELFIEHYLSSNNDGTYPPRTKGFIGQFSTTEFDEYVLLDFNLDEDMSYSLHFPNKKMIEELFNKAPVITGFLFKRYLIQDETESELLTKIEFAAKRCKTTPTYIITLAKYTSELFILDLAMNFYSFFAHYWQLRRENS